MASATTPSMKVFVYGTLKNGFDNHRFLQDAKNGVATFLGNGKTKERYPLVVATSWSVPFLLNKPGVGHNVEGEIYQVDDIMLKGLDQLENKGVWYDCKDVDVITEPDHVVCSCYCYIINNFHEHLLDLEYLQGYSLDVHLSDFVKRSERAAAGKSLIDIVMETKQLNKNQLPS